MYAANKNNYNDDTQVTEVGEYQINVTTATHDRNPSQSSKLMTLDDSELKKKSPHATVCIYHLFCAVSDQPDTAQVLSRSEHLMLKIVLEVGRRLGQSLSHSGCPVCDCGGREGGRKWGNWEENEEKATAGVCQVWSHVSMPVWPRAPGRGHLAE